MSAQLTMQFDGPDVTDKDAKRLGRQLEAVKGLMADGRGRTLAEISEITGYPEASVSARLRDLRKDRFGAYYVDRRNVIGTGTWYYRIDLEGE